MDHALNGSYGLPITGDPWAAQNWVEYAWVYIQLRKKLVEPPMYFLNFYIYKDPVVYSWKILTFYYSSP